MEINRNNYEIFFLDYLDGKLSGDQIDQFLDFLKQNPDLKEELNGLDNFQLPKIEANFKGKNSLYKSEKDHISDQENLAVAYIEGDLDDLETTLFLKHLDFHPQQKRALNLLMHAKLQADESIQFPDKKKLYKTPFSRKLIYWTSSVAAIIMLFLVINSIFNNDSPEITKIAFENPTPPPIENIPVDKIEVNKPETAILQIEVEKPEPSVSEKIIKAEQVEVAPVERELFSTSPITSRNYTSKIVLAEASFLEPVDIEKYQQKGTSKSYTLNEYLVEEVLGIENSNKISKKSIVESGLEFAANVTDNRFKYEKEEGKVSKLKLDTKLFAFSIPIKK